METVARVMFGTLVIAAYASIAVGYLAMLRLPPF
jgi:hypothetical protein